MATDHAEDLSEERDDLVDECDKLRARFNEEHARASRLEARVTDAETLLREARDIFEKFTEKPENGHAVADAIMRGDRRAASRRIAPGFVRHVIATERAEKMPAKIDVFLRRGA